MYYIEYKNGERDHFTSEGDMYKQLFLGRRDEFGDDMVVDCYGIDHSAQNKETEELVRVVFYVVDDFRNPHLLRKSHIGYLPKGAYDNSVETGSPTCFAVGSDTCAKTFPDTITK